MHNIYNKIILTKDGTLIDNWFEEGELRKITGEGRTIKGTTFGKITFDPEVYHSNDNPHDDTYQRVIGEKEPRKDYSLTSKDYGQNNDDILQYTHPKLNVKDDKEKLNIYIKNSNKYKEEAEKCGKEFRSFETTNKSLHPPQPFKEYIGLRHMLTQDREEIPREKAINFIPIEVIKKMGQEAAEADFKEKKRKQEELKRLQAQSKLSPEELLKETEEEPSSFWLNNINSSDIYHSFTKGINPWARSSGFTQKLQNTRGAYQYYQNAFNSPLTSNYINTIKSDNKKLEEEKMNEMNKNMNNNLIQNDEQEKPVTVSGETINKILKGCAIKGWVGLRELKCYLRNLSGHRSDIINKNDFKYFMAKQAILLNDEDVDTIFKVYDVSKSNYINYIQFLNSIIFINESRKAQIESFKEQVKAPGQNYISFSYLISLADMNCHPEALRYMKTVPDLENEYRINWDNLKEDNRIKENDFKQFFYDVSACVEKDEEFTQILKSLGYK